MPWCDTKDSVGVLGELLHVDCVTDTKGSEVACGLFDTVLP